MVRVVKKIWLVPGSDAAVAIREAERDDAPVEFDTGDQTYRFVPDHGLADQADSWADYDPEKVLAALRAARGAFSGLDTKQLLADIHAQRGQDGHGRPEET